jgi:hypothetical protein
MPRAIVALVLARLFVVLLLAFSLVGLRATTTLDSPSTIEVVDTESATEGSEATEIHGCAACDHVTRQLVLVPGTAEGPRSSPDLGRVFRPPRSLGS